MLLYPVVCTIQVVAFEMLGPATEIPVDLPAASGDWVIW